MKDHAHHRDSQELFGADERRAARRGEEDGWALKLRDAEGFDDTLNTKVKVLGRPRSF